MDNAARHGQISCKFAAMEFHPPEKKENKLVVAMELRAYW
jgi:hypothetical protein